MQEPMGDLYPVQVESWRPRKGDTVTFRERLRRLSLTVGEKLGTVMDVPEHDPFTFSVEDSDGGLRWLGKDQVLEVYRHVRAEGETV